MADRSYYQILQVDPEAEPDVIAAAYRVLAARLDPEHDITGVAQVRMAELARAYATLRDPNQRQAYDASQAARLTPVGPGPSEPAGDPTGLGGTLSRRVAARSGAEETAAGLQLDFGRYSGWTLAEILRQDPDYLRWLARHSSGIRFRGPILRMLADHDGARQPAPAIHR